MYEFMSNQILGISGLINLSNIVFLVAFSIRDVLKLRILAIIGEGLTLPYYYFRITFSSIDKREFLKLISLSRWVDCSSGEVILKKGQHISEAIVAIAGDIEATLSDGSRVAIRPGQLIGDVSAYSGLASPADVVARGPGTLAKWDLRHVREFTASRPELRANLLRMVSMDLAVKLLDIVAVGPSLAGEKLFPK